MVKEKIKDGTWGKILSARVVLTWCKPDEYYGLSDWKGTWEKEGGVLIDQAIHSIDLANWFIDDEIENDREPTISGKEALKIQKLICDIYEKGARNFEKNKA